MNQIVYVEPKLLKGEALQVASFIKELDESWVLQSASPETGNIDVYEKMDVDQVLQMFPEVRELFELQPKRTVINRKGKSGKWYDFV